VIVDDNLTDEQRAEQVRGWLRDNGWFLLAGLVLGLGALFGWRQWDSFQTNKGEAASALYDELMAAVRVDRSTRAAELTEQIVRDYPRTPYADQARLAMAKVKLDAAAPDDAVTYLEQVMRDAASEEMATVARLRLARVMIQQERADEALKLLEVPEDSAFAARFHEARGDAYYAKGQREEAATAYRAALDATAPELGEQAFLQAKLDEVGGAAPAAGAPTE
jgi:predicted negative regulator of RcsB-dependent stress response